jgi:hypothetical protein
MREKLWIRMLEQWRVRSYAAVHTVCFRVPLEPNVAIVQILCNVFRSCPKR